MSDAEAEATFRRVRWPETNGKPVCPKCGESDAYDCRRPNGAPRFRCRECRKDFSVTSGTLFASHKLPLRVYLAAVSLFCNEVKGKSALAMSRELGTSYKAAFVLLHKLREAMGEEMKGRVVGGEGKSVAIDGGYFGGYVKPANFKEHRVDRRLARNQNGKRQCVVIVREREGNSVPAVFRTEGQALNFIRSRIAKGSIVNADEATAWNALHGKFEMRRINHEEAYSMDGACTNDAESYFSRLRRAEIGHHHHVAGVHLLRYAQESSWREDHRRMSNGEQRPDAHDVQRACEIIGEHVQRHLGRDSRQGFHQEVGCSHPRLDRAERVLDRLATHAHPPRVRIESSPHCRRDTRIPSTALWRRLRLRPSRNAAFIPRRPHTIESTIKLRIDQRR